MTTEELIAEIERLDAAATSGPWVAGHLHRADLSCDCTYVFADNDTSGCVAIVLYKEPDDEWASEYPTKAEAGANQELIASYRTLAVEAARRLREMLDELREVGEWAGSKE